jgi:preprotein translocase subunit SecG
MPARLPTYSLFILCALSGGLLGVGVGHALTQTSTCFGSPQDLVVCALESLSMSTIKQRTSDSLAPESFVNPGHDTSEIGHPPMSNSVEQSSSVSPSVARSGNHTRTRLAHCNMNHRASANDFLTIIFPTADPTETVVITSTAATSAPTTSSTTTSATTTSSTRPTLQVNSSQPSHTMSPPFPPLPHTPLRNNTGFGFPNATRSVTRSITQSMTALYPIITYEVPYLVAQNRSKTWYLSASILTDDGMSFLLSTYTQNGTKYTSNLGLIVTEAAPMLPFATSNSNATIAPIGTAPILTTTITVSRKITAVTVSTMHLPSQSSSMEAPAQVTTVTTTTTVKPSSPSAKTDSVMSANASHATMSPDDAAGVSSQSLPPLDALNTIITPSSSRVSQTSTTGHSSAARSSSSASLGPVLKDKRVPNGGGSVGEGSSSSSSRPLPPALTRLLLLVLIASTVPMWLGFSAMVTAVSTSSESVPSFVERREEHSVVASASSLPSLESISSTSSFSPPSEGQHDQSESEKKGGGHGSGGRGGGGGRTGGGIHGGSATRTALSRSTAWILVLMTSLGLAIAYAQSTVEPDAVTVTGQPQRDESMQDSDGIEVNLASRGQTDQSSFGSSSLPLGTDIQHLEERRPPRFYNLSAPSLTAVSRSLFTMAIIFLIVLLFAGLQGVYAAPVHLYELDLGSTDLVPETTSDSSLAPLMATSDATHTNTKDSFADPASFLTHDLLIANSDPPLTNTTLGDNDDCSPGASFPYYCGTATPKRGVPTTLILTGLVLCLLASIPPVSAYDSPSVSHGSYAGLAGFAVGSAIASTAALSLFSDSSFSIWPFLYYGGAGATVLAIAVQLLLRVAAMANKESLKSKKTLQKQAGRPREKSRTGSYSNPLKKRGHRHRANSSIEPPSRTSSAMSFLALLAIILFTIHLVTLSVKTTLVPTASAGVVPVSHQVDSSQNMGEIVEDGSSSVELCWSKLNGQEIILPCDEVSRSGAGVLRLISGFVLGGSALGVAYVVG